MRIVDLSMTVEECDSAPLRKTNTISSSSQS